MANGRRAARLQLLSGTHHRPVRRGAVDGTAASGLVWFPSGASASGREADPALLPQTSIQRDDTSEEAIISQTIDLAERQKRLVPLIFERVELPLWLHGLVGIDFTADASLDRKNDSHNCWHGTRRLDTAAKRSVPRGAALEPEFA